MTGEALKAVFRPDGQGPDFAKPACKRVPGPFPGSGHPVFCQELSGFLRGAQSPT